MKGPKSQMESETLKRMYDEVAKSDCVVTNPSDLWKKVNDKILNKLSKHGIQNFKRIINDKYFQSPPFDIFLTQLFPLTIFTLKNFKFSALKEIVKSISYNNNDLHGRLNERNNFGRVKLSRLKLFFIEFYIILYCYYVKSIDSDNILESVREPNYGNPYSFNYINNLISQDLLHSICEFYGATEGFYEFNKGNILEIGAGYGRLATIFLNAIPSCKYTIVDIPISLYLSQNYLTKCFASENTFKFRHFENFAEIENEFYNSKIRFLMPHQISLIPDKEFDLIINISSFHEMTPQQIEFYYGEVNRLCCGYFYSKQWKISHHYQTDGKLDVIKTILAKMSLLKKSKNNITIKQNDYPTNSSWNCIYNRTNLVRPLFFESLFSIE